MQSLLAPHLSAFQKDLPFHIDNSEYSTCEIALKIIFQDLTNGNSCVFKRHAKKSSWAAPFITKQDRLNQIQTLFADTAACPTYMDICETFKDSARFALTMHCTFTSQLSIDLYCNFILPIEKTVVINQEGEADSSPSSPPPRT